MITLYKVLMQWITLDAWLSRYDAPPCDCADHSHHLDMNPPMHAERRVEVVRPMSPVALPPLTGNTSNRGDHMKTLTVLVIGFFLGRYSKKFQDLMYDHLEVNITHGSAPGRLSQWLLNRSGGQPTASSST